MEYKNAVDVVKDSKGNEIKLHDVCKVLATGEIVIVEEGTNKHHKTKGLIAINDVIGLQDWLDVYPSGTLEVVGNMAVSVED